MRSAVFLRVVRLFRLLGPGVGVNILKYAGTGTGTGTSTTFKHYTGLIETSKTHFYGRAAAELSY